MTCKRQLSLSFDSLRDLSTRRRCISVTVSFSKVGQLISQSWIRSLRMFWLLRYFVFLVFFFVWPPLVPVKPFGSLVPSPLLHSLAFSLTFSPWTVHSTAPHKSKTEHHQLLQIAMRQHIPAFCRSGCICTARAASVVELQSHHHSLAGHMCAAQGTPQFACPCRSLYRPPQYCSDCLFSPDQLQQIRLTRR